MRTLRARVALLTTVIVALALTLTGLLVLRGFVRSEARALDADLLERADMVRPLLTQATGLGGTGDGRGRPQRPVDREALLARLSGAVDRLLGQGFFLAVRSGPTADPVVIGDAPSDLPARSAGQRPETYTDGDGRRWRVVRVANASAGLVIQLGADLEQQVDAGVRALARRMLAVGGLATLIVGLATFLLVGFAARPLRRLREATDTVAATEDLTTRVDVGGAPEEVAAVAAGLNTMLARLERSRTTRESALHAARRFAADAGHELRTPLTAMQANLDTLARNPDAPTELRREIVAELLDEQHRVTDLLSSLQALARAEAGAGEAVRVVEVVDLVSSAVDRVRQRHPALMVRTALPAHDVTVAGSPSWLRSILDNLLSNAAVHGGRSARVTLEETGGWVVLHVEDDGPGIPPAERARVFGRFARGADAVGRPGSGLGLALVAQLVALHGGTVTVDDSPLGGARLTVRLPGQGYSSATAGPAAPSGAGIGR